MTPHRSPTWMLAFTLAGCASGFPGARPLTYATPGEAHVYASGGKCIHEAEKEEAAGLVAALLTGVASQLLKNFGSALTEGAKGGALPSSTSTQNLQLEPGSIPKCIVIIRGSSGATPDQPRPIDLASYLGLASDAAEQRKRLDDLKLPSMFRIDHFVELRISASNNNKALTFAPVFVKVAQSIDGATSGERDLSIALKFNRAGAEPVGSAIVVADRKLGASAKWEPTDGRYAIEAPWFVSFHEPPAISGTSASASSSALRVAPGGRAAASGPVGGGGAGIGGRSGIAGPPTDTPESGIASMQSKKATAVPVTVTATVVETRPTNEGLAFIAAVFNGLEPKIEETLKPIIDSDAKKTVDAASLGAQADYAEAQGGARAALISYCSLSSTANDPVGRQDRITKSTAARSAQLKANVAAIKANVSQPYSVLVTISADSPNSVNSAACGNI